MMTKDLKGLALTWNCCVKASEVLYRSFNEQPESCWSCLKRGWVVKTCPKVTVQSIIPKDWARRALIRGFSCVGPQLRWENSVHRTTINSTLLKSSSHERVERGKLLRKESNKESRCIIHKYGTWKTWKTWKTFKTVLWWNKTNIQLVCIQNPMPETDSWAAVEWCRPTLVHIWGWSRPKSWYKSVPRLNCCLWMLLSTMSRAFLHRRTLADRETSPGNWRNNSVSWGRVILEQLPVLHM